MEQTAIVVTTKDMGSFRYPKTHAFFRNEDGTLEIFYKGCSVIIFAAGVWLTVETLYVEI